MQIRQDGIRKVKKGLLGGRSLKNHFQMLIALRDDMRFKVGAKGIVLQETTIKQYLLCIDEGNLLKMRRK